MGYMNKQSWLFSFLMGCGIQKTHAEEPTTKRTQTTENKWSLPTGTITDISPLQDGVLVSTQNALWKCEQGKQNCSPIAKAPQGTTYIDQIGNTENGLPWII